MANYIITGGAGFIGSNLAKSLIQDGHRVYVLDDLSTGFERNIPKTAVFHQVDLSQWEKLDALTFENITAIYHLAAQSSGEASFDDPSRDIDVNYRATYNTLKLCQKLNCKRYIFASSMSVYGEVGEHEIVSEQDTCMPVSYYGLNKHASENLIRIFCKRTDIQPTALRLFNVYGQGQNMNNMKQGMVSIYLSFLIRSQVIHVKGSLDRFRDFIYVDDVVEAFKKVENNSKTYYQNINLGTGKKTTVQELLEAILSAYQIESFEDWIRVEGSTVGDVKGCIANTQYLYDLLEWKPKTTIFEGIKSMKNWLDATQDWWK